MLFDFSLSADSVSVSVSVSVYLGTNTRLSHCWNLAARHCFVIWGHPAFGTF